MSEAGDYDPGPWRGHSFRAARKDYDVHVGRSYDDAKSKRKDLSSLLEPKLTTKSESPLVIACDVTGSMGDWPATIFSKLPYLDLEGQEYMGKTMEICFAAVGDAYCDDYALQVRNFAKGTDLKKRLKELVIEGGGGGQVQETYELAAAYFANKVKMPNAINPLFIFIGDEKPYPYVDSAHAKEYLNMSFEKRLPTKQVIKDLQSKFAVYTILKPYHTGCGDRRDSTNETIYNTWANLVGDEHISILPQADRVVDVIFGIMAQEQNRRDYFVAELTGRQTPEQVDTVMKALESIHLPASPSKKKLAAGKSVMPLRPSGKKGKTLL